MSKDPFETLLSALLVLAAIGALTIVGAGVFLLVKIVQGLF